MYSSDIRDDYIKIEFQFSSKYIDEGITLIKDTFNEKELNLEDLERIKRVYIASYIKSFNDVVSIQESISSDIMDKNKINSNLIGDYEKINITLMKEIYNNINLINETMYIVKAE